MRLIMVVDDAVWDKLQEEDEIGRQLFRQYMDKRAKLSYDSYRHQLATQGKPLPAWLDQPINYFVWHTEIGELFEGDLREMLKGPVAIYCYWVPESGFQEWKKAQRDKGIGVGE